MIPEKMDNPVSITATSENSIESIVDWFVQHKRFYYILGLSYLRSQQQMEELFYRCIKKVHKELPRFKSEASLETWVTSIFIDTCRELSFNQSLKASEKSEQHQELFHILDQMNENEKEAIVLTYLIGVSHEEAAHLLQVPVEKVKELLFSGIQLLRKKLGYGPAFKGCKEYQKDFIDYLERTLDRSKKIDFEIHLYHCQDCQEDLATFQEVMLYLTERMKNFRVPPGFVDKVKARLAKEEKHGQLKHKKRIRVGVILTSVFIVLMGIGFLTGAFTNLYYTWTESNPELRAFLQHGLGERLNLEAESNGVKIKIIGVVADDVQTLIFYKIEDTNEENQYMLNNGNGVFVEYELKTMNRRTYPNYYPPDLESDINNKEKNVYHGRIILPPIGKDNEKIKLKITKLQKLFRDPSNQNRLRAYGDIESKTGEWNFEIPVTKNPSIEYSLKGKAEVEEIPIRFDKLIIAPTTTILEYGISKQSKKQIDALVFDSLEVNHKKVNTNIYGNTFSNPNDTFQVHFDTLFGEKPKEVSVQIQSALLTIEDPKTIELDASHVYPQTFEYAGSIISIDKVEAGQEAKVVIRNDEIKNRKYDSLIFDIANEGENENISVSRDTERVAVDKNGVKYDRNKNTAPYEEIEQLRYFDTVISTTLHSDDAEKKVIPKRLEIYGYNTTKYLDDVVKISLR